MASPGGSFPAYNTVVFSAVEWDVKAIGESVLMAFGCP